MNIVSIIFGAAAILALILLIVVTCSDLCIRQEDDNSKKNKLRKFVEFMNPEAFGALCLVLFISFSVIAVYTNLDKCNNCNRVVQSAYCVNCGEKNEGYTEKTPVLSGKNICPECKTPCETPYCGDCGNKTVFVEE